jgi:hypothetical protein
MRNLKKTILYLGMAILVIFGIAALNFYISFGYGDIWGFLAQYQTLPKDEVLEAYRSDASKNLTQAQEELVSLPGLTLYEKTFSDLCAKGMHDWKRSDSYAYRCMYRLTYYYGTNRDYKELLLDLERSLDGLGWKIQYRSPAQPTISESITDYSGEIYLVKLPYYEKKIQGSYPITLAINGFYNNSGYWNSPGEEPDPFGIAIIQEIYKNGSNKPPEEIFHRIKSAGQEPIMIAITKEYFRN